MGTKTRPLGTGVLDGPDPLVGIELAGRYFVEEPLADGGMGRVYRGVQRTLNRPVAIKRIHPELMTHEDAVARFMAEAQIVSQLAHPNIVRVIDFGQTAPVASGGFLFLVMEFLDGVELATVLEKGMVLPIDRTVRILTQVLSALGEAHASGVTHRDAKPENILLLRSRSGRDPVKLIDFGIAAMQGGHRVTSAGHFVGTPNYMSPEQIRGESADARADLYAVGATLFYMLTGQVLFDDESIMKILERQLHAERPDPRQVSPDRYIPDELAAVCVRSIAREPKDRFESAEDLARALAAAVEAARGPGARRRRSSQPGAPPRTVRSSRPPQPSRRPEARSAKPQRSDESDFAGFQKLEQSFRQAVDARVWDRAEQLLRTGLERAAELVTRGQGEIGKPAWTSFGRHLGELLRNLGRLEESKAVLLQALALAEEQSVRGNILLQLALTLAELGDEIGATSANRRAWLMARLSRDVELTKRLRGSEAPGAPSTPASARSSAPPSGQSQLRVKPGRAHRKTR